MISSVHPVLNFVILYQNSTINSLFSQQVSSTLCISHFCGKTWSPKSICEQKAKESKIKVKEPHTPQDTLSTKERKTAIDEEYQALCSNHTCHLLHLQKIAKFWDANGYLRWNEIQMVQLRDIRQGWWQKAFTKFQDLILLYFSSLIKPTIIRLILSITPVQKLEIRQLNFNNALET